MTRIQTLVTNSFSFGLNLENHLIGCCKMIFISFRCDCSTISNRFKSNSEKDFLKILLFLPVILIFVRLY